MLTSKKDSSKEAETEDIETLKELTEMIQREVTRVKKEQMTEIWIANSETTGWHKREATRVKKVSFKVM